MIFSLGQTVYYHWNNAVQQGIISSYDKKLNRYCVENVNIRRSYVFLNDNEIFGTTQAASAR